MKLIQTGSEKREWLSLSQQTFAPDTSLPDFIFPQHWKTFVSPGIDVFDAEDMASWLIFIETIGDRKLCLISRYPPDDHLMLEVEQHDSWESIMADPLARDLIINPPGDVILISDSGRWAAIASERWAVVVAGCDPRIEDAMSRIEYLDDKIESIEPFLKIVERMGGAREVEVFRQSYG